MSVVTSLEPAHLVSPTTAVRESYLAGELADCVRNGSPTDWLGPAGQDFEGYVEQRRGVRVKWGVPTSTFWYVCGQIYIGTLVVRHQLTSELLEVGGHIGYHVVEPWQGQGHATAMLASGLVECRRLGIDRVLLTCGEHNVASRKVITANGAVPEGLAGGELRFWIATSDPAQSG
jgi:predicted acetyltransferase